MSKIIVDNIQVDPDQPYLPVSDLWYRPIKTVIETYKAGQWNPDNNYNWIPGMYLDYIPVSARSRIKVTCTIPYVGLNAAHAISHWIFYANSLEIARHCVSGNHLEDNCTFAYDVGSWGTTSARIGYQMRSHANDNNEVRPYTTRYWDGGGSNQNCYGQIFLEEYIIQYFGGRTLEFWVTNNSSVSYQLQGEVTGEDLTIYATVGDILKFNIAATGHPFWIKTSATTGTGSGVTQGTITGNGTELGTVTWNTTGVTAGTYYYICQLHGAMSGQIIISARPT
jgi:plastocyanin